MNMETQTEDKLLQDVVNKINYETIKDILVKPLDTVMVNKEITTQVATGNKDENGYELYDTKTETKEVASDFNIGIVLVLPIETVNTPIKVGDKIAYNKKFAKDFVLYKNSQLVKPYDVIALVK